jgi:hypothetical protein
MRCAIERTKKLNYRFFCRAAPRLYKFLIVNIVDLIAQHVTYYIFKRQHCL